MTDPCEQCGRHPLLNKRVDDLEKKYGISCDRIGKCEDGMHSVDMLRQDQAYLKGSLDEIKKLHRDAIKEMREGLKEAIEAVKTERIAPMADRIARGEKIIYTMFFLLVGLVIKAFFGGP